MNNEVKLLGSKCNEKEKRAETENGGEKGA